MPNLTLAWHNRTAMDVADRLNGLVGRPHPDRPEYVITGVVSVVFTSYPIHDDTYVWTCTDALAVVSTSPAVLPHRD